MISFEEIQAIAESGLTLGRDREFFARTWSTAPTLYEKRLRALGFTGLGHVLDLGSGMGQWLRALAGMNEEVTGLEYSPERVAVSSEIILRMELPNVRVIQGPAETQPFADHSFDAIFSYSVLLLTDYRKALAEAYRVLKPGGRFYLNTNGLGWYIYNLVDGHNSSENFSARDMAIETLANTIQYFATGQHRPGSSIVMPKALTLAELEKLGFKILAVDDEGKINLTGESGVSPFFPGEKYGHEAVFEILCVK